MARYTIELTPMEVAHIESTLLLAASKYDEWENDNITASTYPWGRDADELREIAEKFKQAKPTRD